MPGQIVDPSTGKTVNNYVVRGPCAVYRLLEP